MRFKCRYIPLDLQWNRSVLNKPHFNNKKNELCRLSHTNALLTIQSTKNNAEHRHSALLWRLFNSFNYHWAYVDFSEGTGSECSFEVFKMNSNTISIINSNIFQSNKRNRFITINLMKWINGKMLEKKLQTWHFMVLYCEYCLVSMFWVSILSHVGAVNTCKPLTISPK